MTTQVTTQVTTLGARLSAGLRRHRSSLVIAGGVVAALVVVVWLGGGGQGTTEPLDPDNAGPSGARAVARVLADQGVDVTVVRNAESLEAEPVDAGTTVLVTSTWSLGESTADRLLSHVAGARLVLAEPGQGATQALGYDDLPFSVNPEPDRPAGCDDPLVRNLEISVDSALEYPGPEGCFAGDHGSFVVEPEPGVVLLGAAQVLENDQVLRADNAAVALRLLGQSERLVWYVPDPRDLVAEDGVSLSSLLPQWLRPGLWLAAVAMVAVIVWRGRRLGPLATEPLPVVVKAIETTRSRGRLYRKAGDRHHAAQALRTAARTRIAERLRLPRGVEPAVLVRDVARQADRPAEEVAALLSPEAPSPGTDHDLIVLAAQLAELDREVRRT